MKNKINPFLILILSFTLPSLLFADLPFESLDLPENILKKTNDYSIESITPSAEPGFLKFKVHSDHADYEVVGVLPLVKLLHEIEVIERVRRNEQTSGFFDGAAASVEATKDGFVNLVAHPVNSMAGVGKAVGGLGRMIGGTFRKKESGEKTSFRERVQGSSERELAKQFDVDVYTTNPYLKQILRRMAASRMGGKGAAMIVKFLIPVAGLASVALTASGVNAAADQMANHLSRSELFRQNKLAFAKMGFKIAEINQLLDSSFYTPREMTYLRTYLERLQSVAGREDIFKSALSTKSVEEAHKILYESQLAATNAEKYSYEKINILREGIAVKSKEQVLFFTPYDDLDMGPLGDSVLAQLKNLSQEWQIKSVTLLNAGKITDPLKSAAQAQNIQTQERLLWTQQAI